MPVKALLAAFLLLIGAATARSETVTIFAAASAADAIDEIGRAFASQGLGTLKGSYAASSTLAKQIELGAPANLFLSADNQWMDYLEGRRLTAPGTRRELLGNALVLVAPAGSPLAERRIDAAFPFAATLGGGRLAVGDPDHVPAGLYARQALARLGAWPEVEHKLARAASVRAALALVERGEAPLGIVYASDATASRKVKLVGAFPPDSHDPIVYPVAIVAGNDTPAARALLAFLSSPEAKAVFARHGFQPR
ncbi:MAG: molybdate ABC transporter substrate-binding protein [Solirubrobacterales bacterium]